MPATTKAGLRAFALLCALGASASARAEWSINMQVERFRWNEDITPPEVVESGARTGIGWSWAQERDVGLRARYRGGLYAGSVKYKGQEQFTGTPAQTTTDYAGFVNELHLLYRPSAADAVQLVGGLGWDYWRRTIPSTSQMEGWSVIFARLGLEAGTWTKRGWFVGGGLKYPLYTEENAYFQDAGFNQNPPLHPGRELSLYAETGYRFNQRWKLTGYYDSFRFARSPTVRLTSGGTAFTAHQPRSSMNVLGLRLDYFF